ncbi:hypothetical protein KGY64_00860 [Candidatus Bipolaricaulota bacterium]|nr:hypothetical protein [Candidatus Bipolaricaulota bacterium]
MAGVVAVQHEVRDVKKRGAFEILTGDTRGSPAVRSLIEQGADVIVGPSLLSVNNEMIAYLTEVALVLTVNTTARTRKLDRVGDEYLFRTVASDSLGAYAIVLSNLEKFSHENTYRGAGLIFNGSPAMSRFAEPLGKAMDSLGLNLVIS